MPTASRDRHCNRYPGLFACALASVLLTACASLPDEVERLHSEALADTDATQLGKATALETGSRPGDSGFHLIGDGLDAFVARAILASAAERSIDAQYYLLHNDLVGRLFIDQLLKAADRGVRVRLLVDDMDLGGRTLGAAALDSHPNMEVRLFNPFYRGSNRTLQLLTRFGSVTRRMHNKSFTVDNQVAIIGGRNIGNEYFDADPRVNFTDIDVMLIGPTVAQVSESFDRYWNSELAYPARSLLGRDVTPEELREGRERLDTAVAAAESTAYIDALKRSDFSERLSKGQIDWDWGPAEVVYDAPEKLVTARSERQLHLGPQVRPYFEGVGKELLIISPYFVPGKDGTKFLTALVERGVRVIILTNALSATDVPVVHAGYAKYRKRLLRGGVELYEFKPAPNTDGRGIKPRLVGQSDASLHSKAFIFDRTHFFIGSVNFDPRSVFENTEIGVVFKAPELGEDLGRRIEDRLEAVAYRLALEVNPGGPDSIAWHEVDAEGNKRRLSSEPDTGPLQLLAIGLLGLLPIESQL